MAHELVKRPTEALVAQPPPPLPEGFDPGSDPEWQRLWLAMRRRSWRCLAIVPCGRRISTLSIASAFAHLAWHHQRRPSRVVDGTNVKLADLESRLADASMHDFDDELTFLALGQVTENPNGLALARAADAALLCITLGESLVADAEHLIDEIGPERFVGTTLVHPMSTEAP